MIESGSLTRGVSADDFGLPPGTALRIERPAAPLRRFVDHYHVFDSDPVMWKGASTWALPSWPMIRFTFDAPIVTRLGNRVYDPIPTAALYGFSSRARRVVSHGGVTVGARLSPLGWARMIDTPAERLRDQLVPLDSVLPPARVADAIARLSGSDLSREVKAILDSFLEPLLATPVRAEPAIELLTRLIGDDSITDITTLSERMEMSPTSLRRLSTRYFGFPPKTLLVQERFLRSLRRMMMAGGGADYSRIAPTYFDRSHFLRDASRFLGMTPRRFLAHDHRYVLAIMRAVMAVKGAEPGIPEAG